MTIRRWIHRGLKVVGVGVALLVIGGAVLFARASRPPDVPVTTVEVVPPREGSQILGLVRKATNVIEHEPGADTLLQRDAHAKPHGCVRAVLTVDDTIPEALRQGVFRDPGRRYQAWVRYSNGTERDDRKGDARGMAIKLMGVEGAKLIKPEVDPEQNTQDFVMINYPTFFLPDLEDYGTFFDYQARGKSEAWFFRGLNPLDWRLREFQIAGSTLYQKVESPLHTRYYSMSSYLFGPHNIKFSAQPCDPDSVPDPGLIGKIMWFLRPGDRGEDFLRGALLSQLDRPNCFRFKVQLQDPEALMPIEDPSVPWDEAISPYIGIATLDIPVQDYVEGEQDRFCENLQFSPFHALPAHRPVGRLNRVREMVYHMVSLRRHTGNSVPIAEPRGWCLDLTGQACPETSGVIEDGGVS